MVKSRRDMTEKLQRTIVLVGMMGAGKSSVGRRLAERLGVAFRDCDNEIEAAAQRTIPEIFADFGEEGFRDGERRVIGRLLELEPHVLATGGGAFVSEKNRALIQARGAVSVWLNASLETLWSRVAGKTHRPLLRTENPKETLRTLLEQRLSAYDNADIHVLSEQGLDHDEMVIRIMDAIILYDENIFA